MNNHGRIGCAGVVTALIAIILVAAVWRFGYIEPRLSRRATITKGISNCRQIIMALNVYAADHGGKYPDAALANPQSSNEVFKVLLKEGLADSESIFGCPISPHEPDGNIGEAPDFQASLEAGENHWAMTAGITDDMLGHIPLVYENAISPSWPPKWNPEAKGQAVRGRAWSSEEAKGQAVSRWGWSYGIIIGTNDGGAQIYKLESKSSSATGLAKQKNGKDVFEETTDPKKFPERRVLDILREE